jgi:putative CRISPR-associated protein (TIGR02619 family)
MRTVITTVGTSLLTNRDRPWAGWRFGSPLPITRDVETWLRDADPVTASAEIHTWLRLGLFEEHTSDRIVLMHSDTDDGSFCAERLRAYANSRGIEAQVRRVEGLTYSDASAFNRGLRRLVRLLAEEIRSGQGGGEAALAATGGFKAEIAVANLVGASLGAPVYYIYEQFEELIYLEPLPIELAPDWLTGGPGAGLLRRLSGDDCVRSAEVDSLLKADGRLEMLVESEEIEGQAYVCPNLLGELAAQILAAPAVDWPQASGLEPREKIRLENAGHHRPRGWESFVEGLARSPFVTSVRYDGTAGRRPGLRPAADNDTDILAVMAADDAPALSLRVTPRRRMRPNGGGCWTSFRAPAVFPARAPSPRDVDGPP